jgi:hypothetical protein
MCWHAFAMTFQEAVAMLDRGEDFAGLLDLITHSVNN